MKSSKWEFTVTHFKTFKDQVVVSWEGFQLVALKMCEQLEHEWDYTGLQGLWAWNRQVLGGNGSCFCF
jgi:hypothetical protein